MQKTIGLALFLSILSIFISCGEPETIESANESTQHQYDLIKVDSIGIELGDSNYVFGAIIDATYLVDGRIALLDILQRKILVFSGNGEFIGSAGREGMGPGEFISPYSITALSDGGFAVSDIQQGRITFFDSTLEYVKELSGFQPMAPDRIRIGPNGSFFGRRHNWYYDEDEDELYSGSEYCLWSDSVQPDQIYQENYFLHSSDDHFFCGIASSEDGRFFTVISHEIKEKAEFPRNISFVSKSNNGESWVPNVFHHGKWAEIISEPEKDAEFREAVRKVTDALIKLNNLM